jgi:hypothetical protein
VIREAIKKATGNVMEFRARAKAELDVKGARAEVATAADNLEAAKATLDAAKRAVTAATERETIRARLVDVQVEEQLALNAETALVTAQKRLAEAAAAADQSRRRATFDRAAKRAAEAKTAFADKYAPAMKGQPRKPSPRRTRIYRLGSHPLLLSASRAPRRRFSNWSHATPEAARFGLAISSPRTAELIGQRELRNVPKSNRDRAAEVALRRGGACDGVGPSVACRAAQGSCRDRPQARELPLDHRGYRAPCR